MTEPGLRTCVELAGLLHFCQVPAMLYFRRHVLQLQPELDKLTLIGRRVFQVLGGAIVLTVLGTGVLVVSASDELARPSRLSFGLLLFLGLFWGLRAVCQGWYAPVWPRVDLAGRLTHWLLLAIFVVQATLYGLAAVSLGLVSLTQCLVDK